IVFAGDVTLSAGRSITLAAGTIYNTGYPTAVAGVFTNGGDVTLEAPYVLLDGPPNIKQLDPLMATVSATVTPTYTGGTFAVDASLIDVRNAVSSFFADTRLTSQTDIRFLASNSSTTTFAQTSLAAPWGNMELISQQVYPTTGAIVSVTAGTYNPSTYTFIY